MAFSPDGLIEGFYDPETYDPEEGKFIMGLQFHPERMRRDDSDEFDYPGCPCAYQEFVKAVIGYQKRTNNNNAKQSSKSFKLDQALEKKRKVIARSFSLAKDQSKLKSNSVVSQQQEPRLIEVGATVRNVFAYFDKCKVQEDKENLAKEIMDKMSLEQLTDLMAFYHSMSQTCSEVLERKLCNFVNVDLGS
ncbi:hypothetical protein BVRB_2g027190 [Beta vulgaris subsp. vulgaris]|nr:hypothetical protein BVRB_2g027190 [Beta vulgaris subsp. vulgaris]